MAAGSSGSKPLSTTTAMAATISTLPPDIIDTHILTRLDGPTLASAACTSSHLHTLASQESLWSNICHSTWPSTAATPRLRHIVSSFPPHGPRSFFTTAAAATATLTTTTTATTKVARLSCELISAVDIHYSDDLIFSKVVETETVSDWFMESPFRIDLLDPKEKIGTRLKIEEDTDTCGDLIDNLTLSWILIEPIQNRATNLSSHKAVSVHRHWLTGEIKIRFAAVMTRGSSEWVLCEIIINLVTCGSRELHVREVSLQMEEIEGVQLNGRDSLVILQKGLDRLARERRVKWEFREVECRERYGEFLERKRLRKEKRLRDENTLDSLCVTFAVLVFAFLVAFFLFGR